MLDIPEAVKNLCNSDSVRKNFRAVFDSGLVITNKDIVMDSLSFRESVFSGDSLTFGPAETSTLSFETVGVRNILGEWFKAWLELDASTLPEELQTMRDDLSFPVYPIPLGRFVVTDCPRNHEAMAHRQVSAGSRLNATESLMGGALFKTIGHVIPVDSGVSCEVAITYDRLPEAFGHKTADETFTPYRTVTSGWEGNSNDRGGLRLRRDGVEYVLYIQESSDTLSPIGFRFISLEIASTQSALFSSTALPKQAFFSADFPVPDAVDITTIAEQAGRKFWSHYYRRNPFLKRSPMDPNSIAATEEDFIEAFKYVLTAEMFLPSCEIKIVPYAGGVITNLYKGPLPNAYPESMPLPTCRGNKYAMYYYFRARYGLTLSTNVYGWSPTLAVTPEFQAAHPTLGGTLYSALPKAEPYDFYTIVIPTSDTGEKMIASRDTSMTFDLEIMQELAGASLELSGAFGCFDRDTGAKYQKPLTDEPVMRLTRGQYESAWWDEYDLAPIGSIFYKIGDSEYVYTFDPEGQSQYILQNSGIFSRFKNITPDAAQAIMDEKLVPALKSLTFVPADIQARGLPYLEAGDCIELEAHDGEVIKTYVMERTMTGTQHLSDAIVADGITIAEVGIDANS